MQRINNKIISIVRYIKDNDTVFIGLAIFIFALIIRIAYFGALDMQSAKDTTFYIHHSTSIVEANGNISVLAQDNLPIYYWLYPAVLALFNNNLSLIILFQIIISSASAFLLYKIGTIVFNKMSGIIAGLSYALLWETLHWNLYVLTDTLFAFILVLALYACVSLYKDNLVSRRIGLGVSLLALFLISPRSAPFFGVLGVLTIIHFRKYIRVIGLAGLGIVVMFLLLVNGGEESAYGISYYMDSIIERLQEGDIVKDRFSIEPNWQSGFSVYNVLMTLKILSYRIFALWFVYTSEFSTAHILINVMTLVPLYVFGVIGSYISIKDKHSTYYMMRLFIISVVITFTIFHTITSVDYDWRYRLPVLSFVVLIAAYGFSRVTEPYFSKIFSEASKSSNL